MHQQERGAAASSPPATSAPFRLGRRPPLDGLRAVAILAVLAFHYGPTKVSGGFLGVDVFFVLSGFLITALLVQERDNTGRISLPAFYLRRARRLLPALFIMLAAVAVYAAVRPNGPETVHVWRDILAAIFYVANWVHGAGHSLETGLLAHTWSLAVEEQFYLLWPAALVLMLHRRLSRRTVGIVVALAAVASTVDAWLVLNPNGSNLPRVAYGLDTRGGGLLIGCVLGLAVGWQVIPPRVRRLAGVAPWIGLAALALVFLSHRYVFGPGQAFKQFVEAPPIVSVATALVIFGVILAPLGLPARILSLGILVWIGRISYGLYLWHFPVGAVISRDNVNFGLGDAGVQLMRVVVTLVIVTLSFYLVEQPILGGYWPPRFPGRRRVGQDHAPVPQ